jgi:hypothetical protein
VSDLRSLQQLAAQCRAAGSDMADGAVEPSTVRSCLFTTVHKPHTQHSHVIVAFIILRRSGS